ncbi:hypothetical protein NFI96_005398 [Prochilodus magdalenae]|nr:hypothetical protein NFI96_005398 [Prochilodus magdalenae]
MLAAMLVLNAENPEQSEPEIVFLKVENAFLVSHIGARPEKHFWIGLSNQRDQHTFEWTNTSKVLFTYFNDGMPGGKQGCVAMTTGILAGLWEVLNCNNQEKYICKQKAEGLITTPAPPTTPAPQCSEGWYPLKNRDFCFKTKEKYKDFYIGLNIDLDKSLS